MTATKQQQWQCHLPRSIELQKNGLAFRLHVVGIDGQLKAVRNSYCYVGHKAEECNNSESHPKII